MKYGTVTVPPVTVTSNSVTNRFLLGVTTVTGCQLVALLLAGFASASVINNANLSRSPAPATLADCLVKEVPGFSSVSKVPIQALRTCMGQVQKRGETETEEVDLDVASYTIDGGKPNVVVT
jgi:hypothetical protein